MYVCSVGVVCAGADGVTGAGAELGTCCVDATFVLSELLDGVFGVLLVVAAGGLQSQANYISRKPLKSTFYSINSLKKYKFLHNNLTILLCRNCAEQIKSIYRLRSYICYFFYVSYDTYDTCFWVPPHIFK